jgi:hypothetical protein
VLASTWPLPDGRLLGCRILSDKNAPYLGECGILWQLTVTPPPDIKTVRGGHWGGGTYIALIFYFGTFFLVLAGVLLKIRELRRKINTGVLYGDGRKQLALWGILLCAALISAYFNVLLSLILLLLMNFLPYFRRKKC